MYPLDLENEESIDLGKLWQVTKAHKKAVGGIIVGCTALATIVAFTLPKQYESTTLVQVRSAKVKIGGQTETMPDNKGNYMELMKSGTVLDPIIDELYEGKAPEKKPDAASFAKSHLVIKNTKGTNLITVTAKGKTPEEAQHLSQEVVDNFLKMQAGSSVQTQSLLVQFFNERIETAKKDYDDAAQKLADFSREHKIYSSDDPIKQNPNIASDEMGTYLQLKSEAELKKTVYTNLIQQCEEDKVQDEMASKDIQVIDAANLPKNPSTSRKRLIALAGAIIGSFIASIYIVFYYRKQF